MTHARNYPGANRTAQWKGAGGSTMTKVDKLLLHTTESPGWPSYPTFAPTLTFNPWLERGKRWRQHYPINGSASTLQNAGTYRTNRANVCQVEIVGYCDRSYATKYGNQRFHIDNIPGDAYDELGEFLAWLHAEWEVDLYLAKDWPAYPGGYGATRVRMSTAEFSSFSGVCGHMHAPGNVHGDPGNLNVARILAAAQAVINDNDTPEDPDTVKHTPAKGLVMNMQGGRASDWSSRVGKLVDVMHDSGVSWVAAQECNEAQAADVSARIGWKYRQELDVATFFADHWRSPDSKRLYWKLPTVQGRPAGYPRGALCVGLEHATTGEVWWITNTHLTANGYPKGMSDEQARTEREMQARAIVAHLAGFRWAALVGDLNSSSRDDNYPQGIFDRAGFTSFRDRADVTHREWASFDTGKASATEGQAGAWIDYAGVRAGLGFYKGGAVVDLGAGSDHKALLVPIWLRKRTEVLS